MKRLTILLLALPMAANAVPIEFSYDTGVGVLSGVFDGFVLGDGDTVLVTSVLGTPQFGGAPAVPLPFVGSWEGYQANGFSFAGVGPGVVSFSGITMDIIACDVDFCGDGFLFGQLDDGSLIYGSGPSFGSSDADGNAFNPDAWSLTILAVPEPGTVALLGIGLLGMGLARRTKV